MTRSSSPDADQRTPLLTAARLEVGYSGRAIVPPLDFAIRPGEIWSLAGRNGAGKSTLLKTLLGLLPRVRGRLDRRDGLTVSYVPQRGDYDLTVPSRVIDFVRGGVDRGWSFLVPGHIARRHPIVREVMQEAGVLALARQSFSELSEGQKQRVLIARAMVYRPDLIVLDEPTSAVDPMSERRVFELLDRLRQRYDLAILMASHQMHFVPEFASHVIFVDRDDGVAVAGTVRAVMRHRAFVEHYGVVLSDALGVDAAPPAEAGS